MRIQVRTLGLWILCVALTGCGVPYRWAAEGIDAEGLIEAGWLKDGERVRLTILREGKPAAGHRLILKTRPEPLVLEIGPEGVVEVPVSRELLAENPWVEVRGQHGAIPLWSLDARFGFSVSSGGQICEEAGEITLYDPATLRLTEVGPDAVYADPGVPEQDIEAAARLVAREREALKQLFGKDPVPIAVALLDSDPEVYRFGPDRRGRTIWGVRSSERQDDSRTIGTVVHEWTHGILRENFSAGDDPDARYLEDGLCEFAAHRVHLAIRGAGPASPAARRRQTYAEREDARVGENFDLIELARENSLFRSGTGFVAMLEQLRDDVCHDPAAASLGYEVGLAWWLSQSEADPGFLEKTLAILEENPDLEAVLRADQPGMKMDSLPRVGVMEVLNRHGS
ncbi:MAG: hypothetical protein VCB42_01430 [Myxococcota bacterium]